MTTTVDPLCELDVDFAIPADEREDLVEGLLKVAADPYQQYDDFIAEVGALATSGIAPTFTEFCRTHRASDRIARPFLFVTGCPIDPELPIFDWVSPVADKYARKRTYVAEGLLAYFAFVMDTPSVAYVNVNDGDRFQDIYPKEALKSTQSQKSLGPIYFHKDLANHFVRPDFVNIVSLRSDARNRVYTTFVRNVDALNDLDSATLAVLRDVAFHTPFDDLTVMAGKVEVGEAEQHAILSDDIDLRYFENRTVGLTPDAARAVERLNAALHRHKRRVLMRPGDFVSIANNCSLHGKEVIDVVDVDALRRRWSMKTVNVYDLDCHATNYLPGRFGVVNG